MNVTVAANVRPGSASTVIVAAVRTRTAARVLLEDRDVHPQHSGVGDLNRLSPAFTAWPSMTNISVTAPLRGARSNSVRVTLSSRLRLST